MDNLNILQTPAFQVVFFVVAPVAPKCTQAWHCISTCQMLFFQKKNTFEWDDLQLCISVFKESTNFLPKLANRNPFSWEVAASMVNMISVHSAWTAIQLCSLHALCKLHAPLLSSSRVCVYMHWSTIYMCIVICTYMSFVNVPYAWSWFRLIILLPYLMWLYFMWHSRLHGL